MDTGEIQKRVFNALVASATSADTLNGQLASMLNISVQEVDGVLEGSKSLSIEEIAAVCSQFGISLDRLLRVDQNNVLFSIQRGVDYDEYLQVILERFKFLNQAKKGIMYVDANISLVLLEWTLPNLSVFRHFMWLRDMKGYERYLLGRTSKDESLEQYLAAGRRIFQEYRKVPTVEFWNSTTISNGLEQIDYFRQMGLFKKKQQVEILYDEQEKLLNHVQSMAEAGEKYAIGEMATGDSSNYKVYASDFSVIGNTILGWADSVKSVMIIYGFGKSIETADAAFCEDVSREFEQHIQKSSLISRVNEKERNRFFNEHRSRIAAYRQKLWTQSL